jgi:hypothetical protein
MNKDFSQAMSERTDKQLVDILTIKRDEYQPEAIIAAEKELNLRQLNISNFYSEEQINQIKEKVNIEAIGFEWYHKALTIAIPLIIVCIISLLDKHLGGLKIGFPLILISQYFIFWRLKSSGHNQIATEFKNWVIYSYYFYAILLIIIGLIVYLFFMN